MVEVSASLARTHHEGPALPFLEEDDDARGVDGRRDPTITSRLAVEGPDDAREDRRHPARSPLT
jgi:hypothetical protein